MRFVQITVASDVDNGEVFYALGEDGNIYERTVAYYGPGSIYQGRSITRGRAPTEPFWRKVDLPFTEPALEETKLGRLEFQEEKQDA